MASVSTLRLYVLRAAYLLMAVGLGIMIWPLVLTASIEVEHMRAVVWCLLAAIGLLALLGIRYPLQMLPLLLFELTWKAIWLLAIGLPLRAADAFTPATQQTWNDCVFGVVLTLIVIPWPYVWNRYVRQPGDRWRTAASATADRPMDVRSAVR